MTLVQEYPITTPYGYVAGYPLNNGFHRGIDYGCPIGTKIIVNGMVIGLSGNTGYSTGAHCHVGKWIGGVVQDPGVGNGFTIPSPAIVYATGEDDTNGKWVQITDATGVLWVYLHMSNNTLVTKGQLIQGDTMSTVGETEIQDLYPAMQGYAASADDVKSFTGMESNTFIRTLRANARYSEYQAQVAEAFRKAALYDAGQTDEYVKVTDLYIKKS